MKTYLVCIITLSVVILGYAFGFITSKYVSYDPTPEQCLNVCVDVYERFGC